MGAKGDGVADEESESETIIIRSPSTEEEWRATDVLVSELKAWDVRQSQSLGFDPEEVMNIFYPDSIGALGKDSLPRGGCLLLAIDARNPAGIAAYRQLASNVCELYHVYVRPACRGRGIGSQLLQALMSKAKSVGYRTMYLETAIFMREAHSLYRALKFGACEPYRIIPANIAAVTMWMECSLVE
jgi:GNAT superfamily N-acetyltransferase